MMNNLLCKTFVMGALICSTQLSAQKVSDKQPWSVRMVESEMIRCPESWQLDFQPKLKWDYCHGLELQAMLDVYDTYGDQKMFDYALAYADTMIHKDGSIETYKLNEYNIDRLNSGKFLFRIYEQTKDEKYKKAIDLLRSQLDTHPRNEDGGFWHKKVYPNQMWLDGLYMGAPFYAEYAFRNNRVQDYKDIVNQFITVARHTYDPKNGLYRHACDVSRKERWADPVTGQSLDAYQIGSSWSVKNYAMVGKSWGTLVGTGYVYNEDGSILVEDGIPVYEAGKEIGDVTPKWLAGFSNEFSYKDWSFGFLLDFRLGGDVYSVTQAFGSQTGILKHTAEGDLRENGVVLGQNYMTDKVFKTADGKINDVAVNAEDFFYNYYTICEMSVFDGSYLKLREAHLTYNFPKSILEKTKCIKAAHVSLVGTNLALLWVHKSNIAHIDPESTSTGGDDPETTATSRGFNSGVGFESNSYPPSRSFGLKLGVTF